MATNKRMYGGNGVNGRTGQVLPQYSSEAIVNDLFRKPSPPLSKDQTADVKNKLNLKKEHLGVKEGIHADDLLEAGWGVIFADSEKPETIDALRPLLDFRKKAVGRLYREYGPAKDANGPGYKGESKNKFLADRNTSSYGPVDPERMPYYLLIVGSPETIPFSFQYDLDVAYAVGRLHFDNAAEYARYARTVVEVESGRVAVPKHAVFFGVANPNDENTQESATRLIAPVAATADREKPPGWSVDRLPPEQCLRSKMESLLGGAGATPALLVSASHGMEYPPFDPLQSSYTGALVCQDWTKGSSLSHEELRKCYFAGEDVAGNAEVAGLIALVFACFGAGYPRLNDFWRLDGLDGPNEIAKTSSVSSLAKRLLAHKNGGALAVIGHIERAWSCSFDDDQGVSSLAPFESAVKVLMEGKPVGMATEYINQKYAEIGAALGKAYDVSGSTSDWRPADPDEYVDLWTASSDTRNYIVVGDPAVRLVTPNQATRKRTIDMSDIPDPVPAPEVTPEAAPETNAPRAQAPAPPPPPARRDTSLAGPRDYSMMSDAVASVQTWMQNTLRTLTTLEVTTYTSSDIAKGVDAATPRAKTILELGGNTKTYIPVVDGKPDDAVLKVHNDAVDRAVRNRAEMLKIVAQAMGLGGGDGGK
jgi:hypothetical protein